MRVLMILVLAFVVSAGLITSPLDRCTDDCRLELATDSCGEEQDTESQPEHDEKHDGDAPCEPMCPNCARPALVALPTLTMVAMFTKVAALEGDAIVTVPRSPSLRGLFRPPRAMS